MGCGASAGRGSATSSSVKYVLESGQKQNTSDNIPASENIRGDKAQPKSSGQNETAEENKKLELSDEDILAIMFGGLYSRKKGFEIEAEKDSEAESLRSSLAKLGKDIFKKAEKISDDERFGIESRRSTKTVLPGSRLRYVLNKVWGYNGRNCRQNVFFVEESKILYNAAAVCVIHDITNEKQSFLGGKERFLSHSARPNKTETEPKAVCQHDQEIVCLALSPNKQYLASAQLGDVPQVRIWDLKKERIEQLEGKMIQIKTGARSVLCMSWAADNEHIAIVDSCSDYIMSIYDIDGKRLFQDSTGKKEVFGICWNKPKLEPESGQQPEPDKKTAKPLNHTLVTCGMNHIKFWDSFSQKPRLGTGVLYMTFTCCVFADDKHCFAGGANGDIYIFNGNTLKNQIITDHAMITCIAFSNNQLFSGSAERGSNKSYAGLLKCWNWENSEINRTPIKSKRLHSVPAAMDIDEKGSELIIGYKTNSIELFNLKKTTEDADYKPQVIMKTHHSGAICGMASAFIALAENDILASGRDDSLASLAFENYAINPANSSEIAIGTKEGRIEIIEIEKLGPPKEADGRAASNGNPKYILQYEEEAVEHLSYSFDGQHLAIGTSSGKVVLLNLNPTSEKEKQKFIGQWTSGLASMYWESATKLSIIVQGDKRIWNYNIGKDFEKGRIEYKENELLKRVFKTSADSIRVSAMLLSESQKCLAVGEKNGLVWFQNWLKDYNETNLCAGRAHCSPITKIAIDTKTKNIYTAGSWDNCLIEWKFQEKLPGSLQDAASLYQESKNEDNSLPATQSASKDNSNAGKEVKEAKS